MSHSPDKGQSSGAIPHPSTHTHPVPPTYPAHLLTSSSPRSGCRGPPLGYGSPKSNLENRNICEQSQGRQDAAAGSCRLSPAKPLLGVSAICGLWRGKGHPPRGCPSHRCAISPSPVELLMLSRKLTLFHQDHWPAPPPTRDTVDCRDFKHAEVHRYRSCSTLSPERPLASIFLI